MTGPVHRLVTFDRALARRRFLLIAAAAAGSILAGLAGCAAPSGRSGAATDPSSPPAAEPQRLRGEAARRAPGDPQRARAALADFGAEFLRVVAAAAPNTVISPYSLYTVLAMARAGARGATAGQLDAALRLNGPDAQGAAITAIDAGIVTAVQAAKDMEGEVILRAANETWVHDAYAVNQEYLDQLAREFGVSVATGDFKNEPQAMRAAINAWVAERTNDLIPELFPEDAITTDTVLVLVNALYLHAAWSEPFTPLPGTGPFTTGDDRTVQAPMMLGDDPSGWRLRGTTGDGWTAVTIPYLGQQLSMTLLVPDVGGFDDVLAGFDAATLTAAAERVDGYRLTMPSFQVSSAPDAKAAANELGIVDIFVEHVADLTGIGPEDLYAQAFVHQAVIKVDENGTEAAAAAGMSISPSSAPAEPRELVVDRPFLFWISESTTGAPLFLGTVTDPTA
jgi:serpin B